MPSEQWIKWEPIKNLSSKYYEESFSDDENGLKFILVDAINKRRRITVEIRSDSYLKRNQEFRQATINFLDKHYGSKFHSEWTFFKIINSKYIKWLSEESYGVFDLNDDEYPLNHFVFLTENSIIDIVDSWEPKVKFI